MRNRVLTPEASLKEKQLLGGGRPGPLASPNDRSSAWSSTLFDEKRRSFVSYRQGAFKSMELDAWWDDLTRKVEWTQPKVGERRLPRKAAWLTSGKCKCIYRYGGTSWPAITWEPWFVELTKRVCEECGIEELPNCCNANLYVDGKQSVGWHADDEPLFAATRRDALIISLSLGASRRFQFHPIGSPGEITEVSLGDGDICTMEGLMQRHYKHRVPIERHVDGPRVNLTWRWIVAHDSDCPLCQGQEPDDSLPSSSSLQTQRLLKRSRSRDRDPVEEAKKQRRTHRFGQDAPPVDSKGIKSQLQSSTQSDKKNSANLGRDIRKLKDLLEKAKSAGLESAEVLAIVSQSLDDIAKLRQEYLLPREIQSLDDLVATASAMKAEAVRAERSENNDRKVSTRSSQSLEPSRPIRDDKARADSASLSAETSPLPRAQTAATESAKSRGKSQVEAEKRKHRALRFAESSDDSKARDRDHSHYASRPAEPSEITMPAKKFESIEAAKPATYSEYQSAQACSDNSAAVQPALSSASSSSSLKAEKFATKAVSSSEAKDTTAKSALASLSKDASTRPLSEAEKRRKRAERFGNT